MPADRAIRGTCGFPRGRAHSKMAVICGTPAPETTRVVQMEPGPMPTLDAVHAERDQFLSPLVGGHVAGV